MVNGSRASAQANLFIFDPSLEMQSDFPKEVLEGKFRGARKRIPEASSFYAKRPVECCSAVLALRGNRMKKAN